MDARSQLFIIRIQRNLNEILKELEDSPLWVIQETGKMTYEQLELLWLGSQSLLDSLMFYNRSLSSVLDDVRKEE